MQFNSHSKDDNQTSSHTNNTLRINLTIPRKLLERVDAAAKQDLTSRSDVIRTALLLYLRSAGRTGLDIDTTDPEVLLKALQTKRLKAYAKDQVKQSRKLK